MYRLNHFIFLVLILPCSLFASFSSPSFDFGRKAYNPAVLAYYFKDFAIGLTHNMSIMSNEYSLVETPTEVVNETEFSIQGQDILTTFKYNYFTTQLNYSPTKKISKIIQLSSAKTYFTNDISELNLNISYQLSNSLGVGINYDSVSEEIKGGSSEDSSDYYLNNNSTSKIGLGAVYNNRNVFFLGAGVNVVSNGGDQLVDTSWQETYLSSTYVTQLFGTVARFELSYLMTPETKEAASDGKNLNHHRQTRELYFESELMFGQYLIPFIYSSKTEAAFSGGSDKTTSKMGLGVVYKFPTFNVAGNYFRTSSEEGIQKESFNHLQITFTYSI